MSTQDGEIGSGENSGTLSAVGHPKRTFLVVSIVAALLVVAVAVSIYLLESGRGVGAAVGEKEVEIGVSRSFLSVPVYVAQARGYFADAGLDATVVEYPSGKAAMHGMFAGEVAISTVADLPIVFTGFAREDFRVVSTFTSSYSFVSVVVRKDRGIERPADLRGKRVGVNPGTSGHFFLAAYLIDNELSLADVETVFFETVDLPGALEEGLVDAISVWAPYTDHALESLGDRALQLPSNHVYRATFSFVVPAGYAQDHPETIKMFLTAIDRAVGDLQDDVEDTSAIIADAFDMDPSQVRASLRNYVFGIRLEQVLLTSWDDIARWAIENQLVDGRDVPNYLDYIWIDGLEDTKPEAISIIR